MTQIRPDEIASDTEAAVRAYAAAFLNQIETYRNPQKEDESHGNRK